MPSPGLERREPAGPPRGVVLMLHGGAKAGLNPVGGQERLVPAYVGHAQRARSSGCSTQGLSLWLLRFGVRGWNAGAGPEPSPVPDARWALDQAAAAAPRRAGRAARALHGRPDRRPRRRPPRVVGVVALAPWLEPSDPVHALAGRHLVAGHGSRDRITSARMTRAYVERAGRRRRLGGVRRHGPARPLHAAPARRLEPVRAGEHPRGPRTAPCPRSTATSEMPGRPRWST